MGILFESEIVMIFVFQAVMLFSLKVFMVAALFSQSRVFLKVKTLV